MTTESDSTEYTTKKLSDDLKKTITLEGKPDTQISITDFSVNLCNQKAGVYTTVTVSCESEGKETKVASWMFSDAKYVSKFYNKIPYVSSNGQGVIIRAYLKTANAAYFAKFKDLKVTYNYLGGAPEVIEEPKEELPEADVPALIVVTCSSESKADELITSLKTLTTDDVTIYKELMKDV